MSFLKRQITDMPNETTMKKPARPIIVYRRVSTGEQGRSRLGLDAQQEAIERFCASEHFTIAADFQDIASGKLPVEARPGLKAALAKARKLKCPVVVSKLDRLSRDVHFISGLMKEKVDFIIVALPGATTFTLHIYAAIAEEERLMIGTRTSAALQRLKASGAQLGNRTNLPEARAKALAVRQAHARAFAGRVRPQIDDMLVAGRSMNAIAERLNALGVTTARGGRWDAKAVSRVLQTAG
jgi:DNA invertase Pin-like site-specific DNA recombinase